MIGCSVIIFFCLKNDLTINLCLNNSSILLRLVVGSCFDLKTRQDIRVGTDTALAFEPKKLELKKKVHDLNFIPRLRF